MGRPLFVPLITILFITLQSTTENTVTSNPLESEVAISKKVDSRILITEEYYETHHITTILPRNLQQGNHTLFRTAKNNVLKEKTIYENEEQRQGIIGHIHQRHLRAQIYNKSGALRPDHMPWLKRRHQHEHDRRHGPQFEDMSSDNITITVQAGHTAYLDCRVSMLRDKTVSWVRRKLGEPPVLLTVGDLTYTGDSRYSVQFRYPGNWRLRITPVQKMDEGLYECQVSTYPPAIIRAHLLVEASEVVIVDEFGSPLKEQYYEIGSTLQLKCLVKGATATATTVWWLHGSRELHRDAVRGGIAVKTDASKRGSSGSMESTLRVGRLGPADAGNYTCALPPQAVYTILVHVLSEESLGELQQGSGIKTPSALLCAIPIPVTLLILVIVGVS